MGGDDDDRQAIVAASQLCQDLEPVHPGHGEIEDQAVAIGRALAVEKRSAVGKLARLKAVGFEQQPQRIPRGFVIVNNENHGRSATKLTLSQQLQERRPGSHHWHIIAERRG